MLLSQRYLSPLQAMVMTLLCCLTVYCMAVSNLSSEEVADTPLSVSLQAPLTTVVSLTGWPDLQQKHELSMNISIPDNAPDDLGIGLWLSDFDGNWFQQLHPQYLHPGSHQLRFPLEATAWISAEGQHGLWDAAAMADTRRGGFFLWSQKSSSASIEIHSYHFLATPAISAADAHSSTVSAPHLRQLVINDIDQSGNWVGHTGQRLDLQFSADPLPANPYSNLTFDAHAVFTHESGTRYTIPAFYAVPMALSNRGDREEAKPAGAGRFHLRFRPRLPGSYQVQLIARWGQPDEDRFEVSLPTLTVHGEPWDDYVRVDHKDPRFLSIDGSFFWPIGLNIRSVNDSRGAQRTNSLMTPDLGTASYAAYIERFAKAGGNAIEIWMSSWNLALEWRGDWPEFRGLGRYSQARAQRLDNILDIAYAHGVRVNLVIRNHGQASERVDREWHNSPYNAENGGVITRAADFFRDQQALAYQDAYHRYLVARFADHPAILGWKLFSEVNLTAGQTNDVRQWHERSAQVIAELDSYDHPITTHWSGDFRQPDRTIVAQPGIDYVCIDAYHGRNQSGQGTNVVHLMWDSTQSPAPGRGLMQFGKPVLVTEYGGNWNAAPIPQLLAEHASAPWAALVAGHGGSPMLWWFEWVDQNDLWGPYRALSHFVATEDLRHPKARAVLLRSSRARSWAAAWARPGHLLGYVCDESWTFNGAASTNEPTTITIGSAVQAGDMTLEWWDADHGRLLKTETIAHRGGALTITSPLFQRHMAFKLTRLQEAR